MLLLTSDGTEREDSYPDQSCSSMGNHRRVLLHSNWDELGSSVSAASLSSEDELKHSGPGRGDVYSPEVREYVPTVVNLVPPSTRERGAHPYSGTEREKGRRIVLVQTYLVGKIMIILWRVMCLRCHLSDLIQCVS